MQVFIKDQYWWKLPGSSDILQEVTVRNNNTGYNSQNVRREKSNPS